MNDVMTRGEIANLERLIRKQERVLKAATDQRAAELKADFEVQMATEYHYDQDAVWKEAHGRAEQVAKEAQAEIATRCGEIGIPREFAPRLSFMWLSKGQNAVKERQAELRRKASAEIDARKKSAKTQIEMWSLQAQTDLASRTLTSEAAKNFLDNMPATADLMPKLEYQQVHALLDGNSGSSP